MSIKNLGKIYLFKLFVVVYIHSLDLIQNVRENQFTTLLNC